MYKDELKKAGEYYKNKYGINIVYMYMYDPRMEGYY